MSNGPFLNLGATCFRTEWRARANLRRLLLRDSPSSQPTRLPNLKSSSISAISDCFAYKCTNYSVPTSGILYPWTGLGKTVRTGTYQYVPVQDGTGQYKNSQLVHTGMYQYILVRTFKISSGFLTHPERVRRDEIRVHGIQCDEVEFQNCTSLVK